MPIMISAIAMPHDCYINKTLLCFKSVIYLKLRQKYLFLRAEQIHKITSVFTQNDDFFKADHFNLKNGILLPKLF